MSWDGCDVHVARAPNACDADWGIWGLGSVALAGARNPGQDKVPVTLGRREKRVTDTLPLVT
jgi:hypothetical protein